MFFITIIIIIIFNSWKRARAGNNPWRIILIFFLMLIINWSTIHWPKRCCILGFQLMFPNYVTNLWTLWFRLIGIIWNGILFWEFFMVLKRTKASHQYLLLRIFFWLLLLLLLRFRLWLRMIILRRLMLENNSLAHINRFFFCFIFSTTLLPITQNLLPRWGILFWFTYSQICQCFFGVFLAASVPIWSWNIKIFKNRKNCLIILRTLSWKNWLFNPVNPIISVISTGL